MVLFKNAVNKEQLTKQLREEIPAKYRSRGKLVLINFAKEIVELTRAKQIEKVSKDWFSKTNI